VPVRSSAALVNASNISCAAAEDVDAVCAELAQHGSGCSTA
jgi:hypothetical protein